VGRRAQGAGSLTDGRALVAEKQIMIVRHGLTTWNEQRRIQARPGAWSQSVVRAWSRSVCAPGPARAAGALGVRA